MNKQTYIKLPNITVSDLQKVVDYLDENNIKYIEYFKEENKLRQVLNEIDEILKQPMPDGIALCKALDEMEIIVNKPKERI